MEPNKKLKKINPILTATVVLVLSLFVTVAMFLYEKNIFESANSADVTKVLVSSFPEYIALFGFAGSLALFGIILSLLTARSRAVDLADIMTASLKKRTEELEYAKDKIENEKRKLSTILSSMGECLIAVSDAGEIVLMNQMAQATLGRAEADSTGEKIEDVLTLVKDGKLIPQRSHPVYKAIKGKDIARVSLNDNVSIKDKSGRVFPVVLSAVSTLGKVDDGEVSVIIVFRDVSTEKAVDEAKTEFVSLAAHQLRMPLTSIRWYSEMLISGDAGVLNPDQKSYLDEIYQNNKRMVNLVNQLLSVSRIRLGTFKIEPVPTDMNEIVESVLGELKPDITKKNMQVVKNYTKDLEKMNADPGLLRVVLQNLISNAIKYTPEKGTITIAIEEGKEFSIKVSDTGYGIPEADSGKIFSQLFRAENIKGKDVEGTGLGLYMVKTIVEQVGGAISFHSEENKGTTFRVTFPKIGMKAKKGATTLG
ncbi:MAG: ATP-binding protein [Patescibacteria group bacterium]